MISERYKMHFYTGDKIFYFGNKGQLNLSVEIFIKFKNILDTPYLKRFFSRNISNIFQLLYISCAV